MPATPFVLRVGAVGVATCVCPASPCGGQLVVVAPAFASVQRICEAVPLAYNPHTKKDLAVIAIDYSATIQKSLDEIRRNQSDFNETRQSVYGKQDAVFEDVVDKFAYDILWIAEPLKFNKRLDRQAGSFLLAGNRARRIQETLALPLYSSVSKTKFRIPGQLYRSVFALLRKMNLTSKSLYGDLNGLARSIRMELEVYSI